MQESQGHLMDPTPPVRTRLPDCRWAQLHNLMIHDQVITVGIGFDRPNGCPLEVFLTGVKHGQDLALILDDLAVVISLALQYGIPPAALAKSMGRLPAAPLDPGVLDQPDSQGPRLPASVVGAVLDLLCEVASQEGAR